MFSTVTDGMGFRSFVALAVVALIPVAAVAELYAIALGIAHIMRAIL
jgi:hypothetical protein